MERLNASSIHFKEEIKKKKKRLAMKSTLSISAVAILVARKEGWV